MSFQQSPTGACSINRSTSGKIMSEIDFRLGEGQSLKIFEELNLPIYHLSKSGTKKLKLKRRINSIFNFWMLKRDVNISKLKQAKSNSLFSKSTSFFCPTTQVFKQRTTGKISVILQNNPKSEPCPSVA